MCPSKPVFTEKYTCQTHTSSLTVNQLGKQQNFIQTQLHFTRNIPTLYQFLVQIPYMGWKIWQTVLCSGFFHNIPHNYTQRIPPLTHQSINQANNPVPQYTNQLIKHPIINGYAEADDAYTQTYSHFKLAGERLTVKRWMNSSLLGLVLMTHVQLNYCSNDAVTVMNHSCSYFISGVKTYPLKIGSQWLYWPLTRFTNMGLQLFLLYKECQFG